MGIINRFIRVISLVFLLSVVGVFALKAYARTLETVPPIVVQSYTSLGNETIVVDLHRNRQFIIRNMRATTTVNNSTTPSPDEQWIADRDLELDGNIADGYVAIVTKNSDEAREMGRYKTIFLQSPFIWSHHSSKLYLIRKDDKQFILYAVDVETWETTDITSLDFSDQLEFMWFSGNNYLMISGGGSTAYVDVNTNNVIIVPSTNFNIIRFDAEAGYILYKPTVSGDPYAINPFSKLEVFDMQANQTRTIDLSHLPSQVLSNIHASVIWSEPRNEFILSLTEGGIASLSLDGTVSLIHPDLRLQGRISGDGEWIMGILEDDGQARLLAYHLNTGEQMTILEDKQAFVMGYGAIWSYVENIALIFDIDRIVRGSRGHEVHVIAINVDTGNILYDDTFVTPLIGQPYLGWYWQWFNVRYPDGL